jgi:hypothetical protein
MTPPALDESPGTAACFGVAFAAFCCHSSEALKSAANSASESPKLARIPSPPDMARIAGM